jgi:ribosomal protein S18 acetylase RimI-like enzyme
MELLDEGSIEPTARLLAVAFRENTAYAYLFPRTPNRHAPLTRFFASTLKLHLPHRSSYVRRDPGSGEVVATLSVIPPGGVALSLGGMLRNGLPRFAIEQGLLGMRRLDRLRGEIAALDDDASDRRPHFYFSMMAVHPDHQRKGHGAALARGCIEEIVDRGSEADTTLNTQREQNLAFYRKLGFELTHERVLGRALGGAGFTTWAMVRRARRRADEAVAISD